MSDRFYWENGIRVPVEMPAYEEEPEIQVDSEAIVTLRTILGLLLESPEAGLDIECLSLITNFGYQGKSLADIGKSHGVSRALVSRRCVDLCKLFNLPPVRAMRKESGRENCRKARIRKIEEEIRNYHSSEK